MQTHWWYYTWQPILCHLPFHLESSKLWWNGKWHNSKRGRLKGSMGVQERLKKLVESCGWKAASIRETSSRKGGGGKVAWVSKSVWKAAWKLRLKSEQVWEKVAQERKREKGGWKAWVSTLGRRRCSGEVCAPSKMGSDQVVWSNLTTLMSIVNL